MESGLEPLCLAVLPEKLAGLEQLDARARGSLLRRASWAAYAERAPQMLLQQLDHLLEVNAPAEAQLSAPLHVRCRLRLERWAAQWQQTVWHQLPAPRFSERHIETLSHMPIAALLLHCSRNANCFLAAAHQVSGAALQKQLLLQPYSLMSLLLLLCMVECQQHADELLVQLEPTVPRLCAKLRDKPFEQWPWR